MQVCIKAFGCGRELKLRAGGLICSYDQGSFSVLPICQFKLYNIKLRPVHLPPLITVTSLYPLTSDSNQKKHSYSFVPRRFPPQLLQQVIAVLN